MESGIFKRSSHQMLCVLVFLASCATIDARDIMDYNQKPELRKEDEVIVNEILERINKPGDQCFSNIKRKINQLCSDIDIEKRKELTMHIMICEQSADGREEHLPISRIPDEFINELTDDSFRRYSIFFLNIDNVCFQSVHNDQSTKNFERVLQLISAVDVTTVFVKNLTAIFTTKSKEITKTLDDLTTKIDLSGARLNYSQGILLKIFESLTNINDQSETIKASISNLKFYLSGIALSMVIGLIFENVFFPSLGITLAFLIFEYYDNKIQKYRWMLKWVYSAAFIAIIINGLRIYLIETGIIIEKGKKKETTVAKIPSFSQQSDKDKIN